MKFCVQDNQSQPKICRKFHFSDIIPDLIIPQNSGSPLILLQFFSQYFGAMQQKNWDNKKMFLIKVVQLDEVKMLHMRDQIKDQEQEAI